MSIGHDVGAALPQMRALAEALMTDTFEAKAPTRTTVDGLEVDTMAVRYSTPGKVSGGGQRDTEARQVSIGGVTRPVLEGGLHIPLSAQVPLIGWEFVCTAVGPASDPSLLGRRWSVVDVPAKSFATARRLDVAEIPQEA